MNTLGFHITILEERNELNTVKKNQWAHQIKFVDTYSQIAPHVPEGDNHFVVIMSFGFRTDALALRTLEKRKYRYLGMLGSSKKMETLRRQLAEEGMDREWLQGLHAPIGLDIKSETPEEIAVSIAAQIISIKNRKP
jgi:xanthine dehydrogenase accessory factor